jgi:hypothetical protein
LYWNFDGGKSYNRKSRKGGKMKKAFLFMFILTALLFCSCFYIRVDYAALRGMAPMGEFHKVVPLTPGGTLSLENINGNIEIRGWEKEEVAVYAEKMFHLPDRPKIFVYPKRAIAPQIDFDKFENFVKIRTRDVSKENEESAVDYYIDVPHSINLKDILAQRGNIKISDLYGDVYVDLTSGDIVIENFSGSLTASVMSGSVDVSLYDLREADEIILTTSEGDVTISLEENVQAHLEVSVPNGEVISEFEIEKPTDAGKLDLQLGEDGAHISLTALNGDIRINRIKTK